MKGGPGRCCCVRKALPAPHGGLLTPKPAPQPSGPSGDCQSPGTTAQAARPSAGRFLVEPLWRRLASNRHAREHATRCHRAGGELSLRLWVPCARGLGGDGPPPPPPQSAAREISGLADTSSLSHSASLTEHLNCRDWEGKDRGEGAGAGREGQAGPCAREGDRAECGANLNPEMTDGFSMVFLLISLRCGTICKFHVAAIKLFLLWT